MDFLAELSKQKADFERKRAAKASTGDDGTAHIRPAKKRARWLDAHVATKAATNKDISENVQLQRQLQEEEELSRSKRALERKAAKYEQMRTKGTDMLLEAHEAENLMVDFDRKHYEGHIDTNGSGSDASGQCDTDDPLVEIEDEFGRTRMVHRSETVAPETENVPQKPANLIYGAHMQHFDVNSKRKDEIWEEVNRDTGETHYDPHWELRTKGTGYMNLGTGADRTERMQELEELRHETLAARTAPPTKLTRQQQLEARRSKIEEARARKASATAEL